jgi:hypothetical protein
MILPEKKHRTENSAACMCIRAVGNSQIRDKVSHLQETSSMFSSAVQRIRIAK